MVPSIGMPLRGLFARQAATEAENAERKKVLSEQMAHNAI